MSTTTSPSVDLRDLAAATPDTRDRFVDAVRAAAILAVVAGHWLIAVVTWDDAGPAAANALAEVPALQWLTWIFQVMPLFFVVGGFANRAALLAGRRRREGAAPYLRSRVRRLAGPVLPLAVAWMVAAPVLRHVLDVDAETVALVTRVMAQPLWFLAVYLLVSAAAPWTLRAHERQPALVVAGLVAATVVNDLARLPYVHAASYLFVFLLAHQLGYALGDGTLLRLGRRHLALLAGTAAAVLLVLTGPGAYPRSMVGVPGEAVSNMSPPSVAIVVLTALQLALVLLVRPAAVRALQGRRLWTTVIAVNASIMTIFLWHLTALVVGATLLLATPIGFPQPDAGTNLWWLTRLPWLAVLAVILGGVVLVAARTERSALRSSGGSGGPRRVPGTLVLVAGTATALAVFAVEGFAGAPAVAAIAALWVAKRA